MFDLQLIVECASFHVIWNKVTSFYSYLPYFAPISVEYLKSFYKILLLTKIHWTSRYLFEIKIAI